MIQLRTYDRLNDQESCFAKIVNNNKAMGFGRMIQIIRYIWTDSLMHNQTFKHLKDEKKELEAAKKGSGEINWQINSIKSLEKELKELKEIKSELREARGILQAFNLGFFRDARTRYSIFLDKKSILIKERNK